MKPFSPIFEIKEEDISYLDNFLLDKDGVLRPMPAMFYYDLPVNHRLLFAVKKGIYQFITIEMLEWLKEKIGNLNAIEIGAGNGGLCKALEIRGIDNFCQNRPEIKLMYDVTKQPTVSYGKHLINFDANAAVLFMNPDIVVGCYITQRGTLDQFMKEGIAGTPIAIDEREILDNGKTLILFGSMSSHGDKYILKEYKHEALYFPWLITRNPDQKGNRVWIISPEKIKYENA